MAGIGQVVARCEVCTLVYELDDLRLTRVAGEVADCGDCGGPLYLVDRDGTNDAAVPAAEAAQVAYVDGWIEGWDACMAAVRRYARDHATTDDVDSNVVAAVGEAGP